MNPSRALDPDGRASAPLRCGRVAPGPAWSTSSRRPRGGRGTRPRLAGPPTSRAGRRAPLALGDGLDGRGRWPRDDRGERPAGDRTTLGRSAAPRPGRCRRLECPARRRADHRSGSATSSSSRSWAGEGWASSIRAREPGRGRVVALKRLLRGRARSAAGRGPVPRRGDGRLAPGSPAHRAGLPGGRARGSALLHHAVHRGHDPGPAAGRGADAGARGGAAAGPGLPGDPLRPRPRRPPPRPQALEHPDRPRGPSVRQRLRPGQAARRRTPTPRSPRRGAAWARRATCRPSRPGARSAAGRSARPATSTAWGRSSTTCSPAGRRSRPPRRSRR